MIRIYTVLNINGN